MLLKYAKPAINVELSSKMVRSALQVQIKQPRCPVFQSILQACEYLLWKYLCWHGGSHEVVFSSRQCESHPTIQLRQDTWCPRESTVPMDASRHVTVRYRWYVSASLGNASCRHTVPRSRHQWQRIRGTRGWVGFGWLQEEKPLVSGKQGKNGNVANIRETGLN